MSDHRPKRRKLTLVNSEMGRRNLVAAYEKALISSLRAVVQLCVVNDKTKQVIWEAAHLSSYTREGSCLLSCESCYYSDQG